MLDKATVLTTIYTIVDDAMKGSTVIPANPPPILAGRNKTGNDSSEVLMDNLAWTRYRYSHINGSESPAFPFLALLGYVPIPTFCSYHA